MILRWSLAASFVALLSWSGWTKAESTSPPFSLWAWNRSTALKAEEIHALQKAGVHDLWWNLGTLTRRGNGWMGTESFSMPAAPEGVRLLPVIRLHEGADTLEDATANERLPLVVKAMVAKFGAPAIQVDYDCPDSLLPRYADVLARCRDAIKPVPLGATALAHWPKVKGYAAFCRSVAEVMPMFYDLDSANRVPVRLQYPAPLADPRRLPGWIKEWNDCPTPWRAGLPNFTRVTLLDANGWSLGHLPEWRWETLVFRPALKVAADTHDGTTLLSAQESGAVGRTPFRSGQHLLVRWPDLVVLGRAMKEAENAGAAGIIFFKLQEAQAPGGWSLSELARLPNEPPPWSPKDFSVSLVHSHLVLTNLSPHDLPPRFATAAQPADRGWTLEVQNASDAVSEISPGGFTSADGQSMPDGEIRRLHFAWLRASNKLESGYVHITATGGKGPSLRWRIPQISPVWNSLKKTSP
jgi:hypothetical protein